MSLSLLRLHLDGPGLLALAAVLGAIVYYVFFRDVRLTRRMKPLVEMLDAGTARLEGGRLSGAYSGKRVWFEYRAQTAAAPPRCGWASPARRLIRSESTRKRKASGLPSAPVLRISKRARFKA